jgi:hypothetical protein
MALVYFQMFRIPSSTQRTFLFFVTESKNFIRKKIKFCNAVAMVSAKYMLNIPFGKKEPIVCK